MAPRSLALLVAAACAVPGTPLAITPSVVANTVIDAGAAVALAAGPMVAPTIAKGYDAMYSAYDGLPEGELFDSTKWRGEFPEYDLTNAALAAPHIQATIAAAFFLFFGSIELGRGLLEGTATSGDWNDVYAMVLYAFAFQGDSLTHAVLASPDGAKKNIMQKGHALDTLPMIAFFLYGNYLDGDSWYALTGLPSDHWWMLAPRLLTSPLFLLLTFYIWQPAHGAGVWLPKNDK